MSALDKAVVRAQLLASVLVESLVNGSGGLSKVHHSRILGRWAISSVLFAVFSTSFGQNVRQFEFVYRAEIHDVSSGAPVHLFIPVPRESEQQSIEIVGITTSLSGIPGLEDCT